MYIWKISKQSDLKIGVDFSILKILKVTRFFKISTVPEDVLRLYKYQELDILAK